MLIALDTETTGTDFRRGCRPFYVATCTEHGVTRGWRYNVGRDRIVHPNDRHNQEIKEYCKGATLVFHNAKFDIRALASIGIHLDYTTFEDTLLASHAVSSTDNHGLKELGVKYLNYPDYDETKLHKAVVSARRKAEALGWKIGNVVQEDYWIPGELDPEDKSMETYAFCDVERTMLLWLLYKELMPELNVMKGYEAEKDLLKVVMKVEDCGITLSNKSIDRVHEVLSSSRQQCLRRLANTTKMLFNSTYNIDSPPQVQELLYDKLNLPVIKNTKKGNPAADKTTVIELMEHTTETSFSRKILKEFLEAKAYASGEKYLNGYRKVLTPESDDWSRMYPSLNQISTATNRFSSSNPNGQNISKKNKYNVGPYVIQIPKIREVFAPLPGKKWLSIDYSQIELRVFAKASGEQSLIDALDAGYDFHGYVASRIFDKDLADITDSERTIAKNVNFALIFGAGENKVNATAGMDNAYGLFSSQFPNAKDFMDKVISYVKKHGYVSTLDGYRLTVPYKTPYKGVNYMVQGTAARIIKLAMRKLDKEIDWEDCKMILQIHDEIMFEVNEGSYAEEDSYILHLMDVMEDAGKEFGINTPVSLEVIDDNWGNGKEVDLREQQCLLTM